MDVTVTKVATVALAAAISSHFLGGPKPLKVLASAATQLSELVTYSGKDLPGMLLVYCLLYVSRALSSRAGSGLGGMGGNVASNIASNTQLWAILCGMLYGNFLHARPEMARFKPGITACKKKFLQIGIILYGFKLTFQQVIDSFLRHANGRRHADCGCRSGGSARGPDCHGNNIRLGVCYGNQGTNIP
jgi:hypothetical protein